MSNLGQKIKEAFTAHHDQDQSDVKTPDVNAPGAFPSDDSTDKHHSDHNKLIKELPEHLRKDKGHEVEKGAQHHHTGHSHHDPEPEAKQATSDAGNYPYWGNLPREGGPNVHRSDGPVTSPAKAHDGLSKDSSLATGASTAGVNAIGAGHLNSDKSKDQGTSRKDENATNDLDDYSRFENSSKVAGAAGIAGATYFANRDKDDDDTNEKKPTSMESKTPENAHKNKNLEETKMSTPTRKPVEAATPTKTTSSGDNDTHRKEEQAIAAGAGAAGLAGAGYNASQIGDKTEGEKRDARSYAAQGGNAESSSHTGVSHHNPTVETQKATGAAGNYPCWKSNDDGSKAAIDTKSAEAATPTKTTSSGDNDTHRREKEAIAAGAGASGLAGAGYLASKDREDCKDDKQSSLALDQTKSKVDEHRTHTSTSQQDPEYDTKRANSGSGNCPPREEQKKEYDVNERLDAAEIGGVGLAGAGYLASNSKEERKDELPGSTRETSSGIAAPGGVAQRDTTSRQVEPTTGEGVHNTVAGAGSSEYSPRVGGLSNSSGTSHMAQNQPVAQAAAKQAWSKQKPDSTNPVGDMSSDNKHSDLKYAAAGTAFGAGAAGLAADYGQGKTHEESPRTDQAEKVAKRALGSDGKPHAPSATQGSKGTDKSGSSSLTSDATDSEVAGQSRFSGNGAKVLHKCEQCGHDNDISHYFDKDAVVRS
jgi:type 1 glutamine amidotransferase